MPAPAPSESALDSMPPAPKPLRRTPPVGGPTLVALGAAGWGTEGLFRRSLTARLAPYPIVLLEHALQVLWTLPWLIRHAWLFRRISRRAIVYVLLSGGIGSALGTVCFTAAYATDVNKTAAAVLLNLQPVVSTIAAALLFGERIRKSFVLWATVAVLAGVGMALDARGLRGLAASPGFAYIGLTIVLWGFATVAGRGAMKELPVGLAAPLRLWAGLLTTAFVVGLRFLAHREGLGLDSLGTFAVWRDLVLLTTVSGALPLFIYFAGLAKTPASIAGYCEMFYTVSAAVVSFLFLDGKLAWYQALAAAVLVGAIVMLNRGARSVEEPQHT